MPEKRHMLKLAKGPLWNWQSTSRRSGGEYLFPRPKLFYSAQWNTFWLPDPLTMKLQVLLHLSLAPHCFGSVQRNQPSIYMNHSKANVKVLPLSFMIGRVWSQICLPTNQLC